MILSIFIAMYAALMWVVLANTPLAWTSWVFSTIILICGIIADAKYSNLLKKVTELEKKHEKDGDSNA